jgi:TRAP transporter TAXI family solute receptor
MIILMISFAYAENPIRIGTGKENGVYHSVAGKILKQQLGRTPSELITSNGSVENLERLKNKEIDIAFMQFDTLIGMNLTLEYVIIKKMYPEYVHLIVAKKGPKSIKDFDLKNSKIAIGSDGSGAWVTWKSFIKNDSSYSTIATVPISGSRALSALESGDITGVLLVGGLGVGDAKRADTDKDKFALADIDDWDFNNTKFKKEAVYEFVKIGSKSYSNLIGGWSSVTTVKVDAILVTTAEWADNNAGLFDKLFDAATRSIPNIDQELKKRN